MFFFWAQSAFKFHQDRSGPPGDVLHILEILKIPSVVVAKKKNNGYILGNYERTLKGPNEIFGWPETAFVAIKGLLGDLKESWDLPKSGIFKEL